MNQLAAAPVALKLAWAKTSDCTGSRLRQWGSAQWVRVDTELSLNTTSKASGDQFADGGYSKGAINSGNDHDCNSKQTKTVFWILFSFVFFHVKFESSVCYD